MNKYRHEPTHIYGVFSNLKLHQSQFYKLSPNRNTALEIPQRGHKVTLPNQPQEKTQHWSMMTRRWGWDLGWGWERGANKNKQNDGRDPTKTNQITGGTQHKQTNKQNDEDYKGKCKITKHDP